MPFTVQQIVRELLVLSEAYPIALFPVKIRVRPWKTGQTLENLCKMGQTLENFWKTFVRATGSETPA